MSRAVTALPKRCRVPEGRRIDARWPIAPFWPHSKVWLGDARRCDGKDSIYAARNRPR